MFPRVLLKRIRYIVRRQHVAERCPATGLCAGAELVDRQSRHKVRQRGLAVNGPGGGPRRADAVHDRPPRLDAYANSRRVHGRLDGLVRGNIIKRKLIHHWPCILVLATAALAQPSSAAAAGTWTSRDLTHLSVSWRVDDGKGAFSTAFKLTQPVIAAQTSEGRPCTTNFHQDPTQVECPGGLTGPASSGAVDITVQATVGCTEGFEHAVSLDGRGYVAQQAIVSGNTCEPPPPPPAPPAESNEGPAGAPVSAPLLPLVVGADAGAGPQVKAFDVADLGLIHHFFAYAPSFKGGVRVAVGDVNGDGRADLLTGVGPGAGPHVKVFDGATGGLLQSFFAYDAAHTGGVFMAAGDMNGDGRADIVTGAGLGGGPQVKVFDGVNGSLLRSFFAYTPSFTGGVRVAAGDVSGDGRADIITGAGSGAGPQVKVFDGVNGTLLRSFFAYDAPFTGGVFVAAGDVSGDGRADVITGVGSSGGPHVKVFDGSTGHTLHSFLGYGPSFTGGVRVAAGDVNRDGFADIVTGAGPGGSPRVKVFSGATGAQLRSFLAFDPSFTGGVFVGAAMFPGARLGPKTVRLTPTHDAILEVSCPARTLGNCRGTVTLLLPAVQKARGSSTLRARKQVKVVLGRARFRAAAGKWERISVHISKAGVRALGGRRELKATARLTTRDGGKNVNTTLVPVVLRPDLAGSS